MLILLTKHYSAKPEYGLDIALTQNLVPPLRTLGLEFETLYVDLIESAEAFGATFWPALNGHRTIWISAVNCRWIGQAILERVRALGVKIIVQFWDMIEVMASKQKYQFYQRRFWRHPRAQRRELLCEYADVLISMDWPETRWPAKTVFFPSIQPSDVFFPTALNGKTIDVSFVGQTEKGERRAYIDGVPGMVTAGGLLGNHLGIEDYADLIRSSKLHLNVPEFRHGVDQLNGRPFEVLHSRTALLQPDGPTIRRFLEPGVEFIPLTSPADLTERVRYYLEHEDEREEIAHRGWRRVTREYTVERLWEAVSTRLGGPRDGMSP